MDIPYNEMGKEVYQREPGKETARKNLPGLRTDLKH